LAGAPPPSAHHASAGVHRMLHNSIE
jgi:hypothetical protein